MLQSADIFTRYWQERGAVLPQLPAAAARAMLPIATQSARRLLDVALLGLINAGAQAICPSMTFKRRSETSGGATIQDASGVLRGA